MTGFRFAGSTVLVTGASSGIGRAFAEQLAAQQAHLVLTARSEEVLQTHAAALRRQHGIEVDVIAADLSGPGAAEALADTLGARGITVDVLVNNAGFGKFADFTRVPLPDYRQMLDLNIGALVALAWRLLPGMAQRGRGGIINLASVAAFQPLPHVAVYAATKAFVLSFSEALTEEYRASGVHVLALCPGYTNTNFAQVANAQADLPNASTADGMARAGIKAFLRGAAVHVPGAGNVLTTLASRLVPRRVAAALAGRATRRFAGSA